MTDEEIKLAELRKILIDYGLTADDLDKLDRSINDFLEQISTEIFLEDE